MNEETICKLIFELVLPYAKEIKNPVAYVNVQLGFDAEVREHKMALAFQKLKWDTDLSGADLFFMRQPWKEDHDSSITIKSLSCYECVEYDTKRIPFVEIENGKIV